MQKRFVPSQSNFGKTTFMDNSVMKFVKKNPALMVSLAFSIAALVVAILAYKNEGFRNSIKEMFGSKKSQLKELDVLFFMSPTCKWCQKMKKVLHDEGTMSEVTVVDVTKPEGQALAKKFGATNRGVPNFISKKLNTGTVGFKPTTQEIVDALTTVKKPGDVKETMEDVPEGSGEDQGRPQEPQGEPEQEMVDPQSVSSLGIVVFTTEGCPWCTKAKADAEGLGIMPFLEFQDLGTADGKAALQHSGIEFKGAPTFFSKVTGKSAVGYRPYNQIISALVPE